MKKKATTHLTLPLRYIHEMPFEEVFDETPLSICDYLRGISPEAILFFLVQLLKMPLETTHRKERDFLFNILIKEEPPNVKEKVRENLDKYEDKRTIASIFSRFSTMKFIEHMLKEHRIFKDDKFFIKKEASENLKASLKKRRGIDILKAYLLFNSHYLNKKHNAAKLIENEHEVEHIVRAKLQLVTRFEEYEIHGDNDFQELYIQFIKAYWFFSFLKSSSTYEPLLEHFLTDKELDNWQQCLSKTTLFTLEYIKSNTLVIVVKSGDEKDRDIKFFDQFCFQQEFTDEENFKYLRLYPFFKLDDIRYHVTFLRFAIQKVFRSLYFDLSQLSDSTNLVKDFKSKIGKEFFEEFLFYKVIDQIFINSKLIKVNGKTFENLKINGAPDYYIRNWNKIFIIECKDITISQKTKTSYDLNTIETELKKKLVESETGKRKGVRQILHFINKLDSIKEKFDPSLNIRKTKIYPIIVTQERSLDTTGLNRIVQHWFQDLMDKEITDSNIKKNKIMPLTIINIDALILYKEILNSHALDQLLESYHKGIRVAADGKLLYSFTTWLDKNFGSSINVNDFAVKLEELRTYLTDSKIQRGTSD